jgi:hypothetical protein
MKYLLTLLLLMSCCPAVTVLVDAPYWVLGTDYDNYAVIWSCSNFGIFSTREFSLTDSTTQNMKHLFCFINTDPASTRSEFVFLLSLLFNDAVNSRPYSVYYMITN